MCAGDEVAKTGDRPPPPLGPWIGLAAVLHALVIAVGAAVPATQSGVRPWLGAARRAAEAEVEVDVVVGLPAPPQPGDSAASRPIAPHGAAAVGGSIRPAAALASVGIGERRSPRGATEDGLPDASGPRGSDAPLPAARPDGEGSDRRPGLTLQQLGLSLDPGRSLFRGRRAVPVEPSAERRVQRSLAAGLAARDRERGLGAHAPVITALEQAARMEATPADGRAQFLVSVDAAGKVVQVEVLEVSADARAWQRAARRALRAFAARRVRLPEGAKGLQIRLEIVSRVQQPSGLDPGLEVSLFGIPLQRGQGERPSKVEMLNPIPELEMVEVPDPGTGEMKKLPEIQIKFVPLLLALDPADIGAPLRRVVSGYVVDVQVL